MNHENFVIDKNSDLFLDITSKDIINSDLSIYGIQCACCGYRMAMPIIVSRVDAERIQQLINDLSKIIEKLGNNDGYLNSFLQDASVFYIANKIRR